MTPKKECKHPGCHDELLARGWCTAHYKRWRRRGFVEDILPQDFFFARVTQGLDNCWLWDRPMPDTGYGQFSDNKKMWLAHRWAYEFFRAEIPDGLVLDHLCKTRLCVNPWHLEPVTQWVNVMRSDNHFARNAAKTACLNGHPFSVINTYTRKDRPGRRQCRRCAADRSLSKQ